MTNDQQPVWQRILLKLSGEALAGDQKFGIDGNVIQSVAKEIQAICSIGVELGIVVGGGNFFRGMSAAARAWTGSDPTTLACWPQP